MPPDQARKEAKKLALQVAGGIDPMEDKRSIRESLTVNDLLDAYLKGGKFAAKAASTRSIDEGRIKRHIRPTMGAKYLHKLKPEDVRRAFAEIRDGKTATSGPSDKPRGRIRVKGGEGTAAATVRLLKAIFSWGVSEGYMGANPAATISVQGTGTRDATLKTAEDYARLFKALDRMEEEHRIRRPAADAIRLIALTGARRGEIVGLRWRHVDLQQGVISLPWKEHKTGQRTGRPRVIGLPTAAQAIIKRQSEGESEDLVFKATRGKGPISLSQMFRDVRAEAGLPDDITLHSLRHSLGSWLAISGAESAQIMEALGHRQLSTVQRYIHWHQDARAELAERAASHVTAALSGGASAPGDVTPIQKRRA